MSRRLRRASASLTKATTLKRHAAPSERRDAPSSDLWWLRRAGVVAIALKLALVPIAFDPVGEDAFGVAKSTVSRALMYVLFAISAIYVASSADARARAHRAMPLVTGLAGFVGIAGVATLLAVDRNVALFGAHHRYLGLTSILDGVAFAAAIPLFISSKRYMTIAVCGLFAGLVVVLGYAAIQVLRLDPIGWTDPTVSSTLGNRGVFAGYLLIVACAAVAATMLERARGERTRAIVTGALAVIAGAAVLVSGARGPFLTLPLAIAGTVALTARAEPRALSGITRRQVAFGAVAILLALGVAATTFSSRVSSLIRSADTSVTERGVIYATALEMISRRPMLGAGPDHFGVLYATTERARSVTEQGLLARGQTSAHSWPLHQLIGTGALGAAALLFLIAQAVRSAWRAPASVTAIGAALLVGSLFQGVFNVTSVGTEFLFWSGLGLCTCSLPAADGPVAVAPRGRRSAGIPARTAIALAVGVAAALTTLGWYRSNDAVRSSDLLRAAGRHDAAALTAEEAVRLDPGRANNWNVLGLARSPRDAAGALAAFQRAASLAPYEARYAINVVKEEARLAEKDPSYGDRVLRHARNLIVIDPRDPETHQVLAFALIKTGDLTGARAEAELAISLAPSDPVYHAWSSAIHEDAGEPRIALERFERALALQGGIGNDAERFRLGRLLVKAGELTRAAAAFRPPAAPGVDRRCAPENGTAPGRGTAARQPLCFRVVFISEYAMRSEPDGAGSVLDLRAYSVDGAALPVGTRATYDQASKTVTFQLPAGSLAPPVNAKIGVIGVTNELGVGMQPQDVIVPLPE